VKRFACLLLIICSAIVGCSETAEVAQKELGPKALLRKYEWFKDAAAALDSKKASIDVYEGRFARLKEEYKGKSRSDWSREDREQSNLWEQEVAGIKASYNSLAADYNAAMAKANWNFCEVGTLPPGATTPLPRAFKPYEVK